MMGKNSCVQSAAATPIAFTHLLCNNMDKLLNALRKRHRMGKSGFDLLLSAYEDSCFPKDDTPRTLANNLDMWEVDCDGAM